MGPWNNGNLFNEEGYCPVDNGIPMIHTASTIIKRTFLHS